MKTEEKAKRYDEALEWMRKVYPTLTGAAKEDAEHYFPELKESEDERVRKHLIEIVETYWGKTNEPGKAADLAWLEKQKEHQNNSDAREKALGRALTFPLDKDKNLDDIAQDYVDGVKEYNPEPTWDLMQTAVCYGYHYCEQKEQKPVQSEVEREYVRTLKSLISDFLRGKEDVDREYYQQIFDWLDGRHIEQKPVDFPTTDEEVNEFLKTHSKVEVPKKYKTPDFVFSKQEYKSYPIISKDTTSVKPAEWSEEDKETIDLTIAVLKENLPNVYFKTNPANTLNMGAISTDQLINRLKSLRPQPKPEWSEEDENKLNHILEIVHIAPGREVSVDEKEELESFLKSLCPQPKAKLTRLDENIIKAAVAFVEQNDHFNCWGGIDKHTVIKALRSLKSHQKSAEWSEEDEEMRKTIIQVLESFVSEADCESNPSLSCSYPTYRREIEWLKSLRPVSKESLQPHWKPSEEQMEALSETIAFAPDTFKPKCTLVTLQDDLKNL